MLKLIKKHLDIPLINVSLVFAIVFSLFFNSAVLIYKFDHSKASYFKTILELSKDFIYIYLCTAIIFFSLTTHKIAFTLGSIFLFITGAIASYFLCFFDISPTTSVIGDLFSTNLSKIHEAISIKLVIWLIFSFLTCIYMLKHFSVMNSKSLTTKLLSGICLLIVINNIITPQFKLFTNYFPIQYLHNSYLYFAKSNIK